MGECKQYRNSPAWGHDLDHHRRDYSDKKRPWGWQGRDPPARWLLCGSCLVIYIYIYREIDLFIFFTKRLWISESAKVEQTNGGWRRCYTKQGGWGQREKKQGEQQGKIIWGLPCLFLGTSLLFMLPFRTLKIVDQTFRSSINWQNAFVHFCWCKTAELWLEVDSRWFTAGENLAPAAGKSK